MWSTRAGEGSSSSDEQRSMGANCDMRVWLARLASATCRGPPVATKERSEMTTKVNGESKGVLCGWLNARKGPVAVSKHQQGMTPCVINHNV